MTEFEPMDVNEALSHISHPIVVVTARRGEETNGMTAAWASQISIEPPIMCVSISPERYTWEMLEGAGYFGVSILGQGQERIAEIFGTVSGREGDKFSMLGIDPFNAAEGIPLIPGSLAAFVCKKLDAFKQGDHFAVFGEVVEAWKGGELEPLRWFRSKYHR